jgi:hypothetical protein
VYAIRVFPATECAIFRPVILLIKQFPTYRVTRGVVLKIKVMERSARSSRLKEMSMNHDTRPSCCYLTVLNSEFIKDPEAFTSDREAGN